MISIPRLTLAVVALLSSVVIPVAQETIKTDGARPDQRCAERHL